MTVELAIAVRAEHAEGPIWDAASQVLWWVDITGHRVHCFDPRSNRDCSWDTGCDVGAVALDSAGGVILALPNGFVRFDPA
ncbi:MAG: SMP-30/gluconolactonase/LRE family protein, partial [Actinobacteria bacterium]|nr:SMP-30/gluconolactonase/LRE family protein [Actinomycetota bacterium]